MQKPVEINTYLYRRLKEYGVQLHNIIDVGCHQGSWTSKLKLIYNQKVIHQVFVSFNRGRLR